MTLRLRRPQVEFNKSRKMMMTDNSVRSLEVCQPVLSSNILQKSDMNENTDIQFYHVT